jgi:predicted Zn finger-like uncharacterized protein
MRALTVRNRLWSPRLFMADDHIAARVGRHYPRTRPLMQVYKKMEKGDLTCPKCGAGFRRIALSSLPGAPGEFRCTVCDYVLEVFDGSMAVAYRLTVSPRRIVE